MEFSKSDFACADKLEAHAEFRKTCSSDPSRISSEISSSTVGVSSNTSKLEEDASTIDNFLVKKVRCRPEAIAAGAEMLTVKLDYSEDVLSEESDFNRITDCSLDGTTETIIHLTLRDIDCPVHTYSSSTAEIASMQSNVQYLPTLQKKRIDLGYQPIQEIASFC
ncbi:hypothetical protein O6H91_12G061300 [Diphasiastrum complanatum]|uniref:Uncharacterized protein n=1 Tax=Diphasiastrum complanatum TaxID=34168 RepID=A0ACC2C2K9_DIPCM|nr:hypothetical protein O6H91_12G061300 [Diphasiastrum complanatum]